MQAIIEILKKLITNPKFEAFVIIGLTSFLKNKFMTEDEQIEQKQPLFLPRGSIRAIITLLLTAVVACSFFWQFPIPEELLALTIFAIGYYVGYRTDNTQLPEIKK